MQRDPKLIELEIDRTRNDLEATIAELKDVLTDKLDIKKNVEHAVDVAIEHAKAAAEHAVHDAKEAMVHKAVDAKDAVVEAAVHTKDTVVDAAGHAKHSVVDAAGHAKISVEHAASFIRDEAIELYRQARRVIRENPQLVVAVLGGAVAAVGITLFVRHRRAS